MGNPHLVGQYLVQVSTMALGQSIAILPTYVKGGQCIGIEGE
jgi:hypothetical protein